MNLTHAGLETKDAISGGDNRLGQQKERPGTVSQCRPAVGALEICVMGPLFRRPFAQNTGGYLGIVIAATSYP